MLCVNRYIVCDNFKKKPDGKPTCGLAAGLARQRHHAVSTHIGHMSPL